METVLELGSKCMKDHLIRLYGSQGNTMMMVYTAIGLLLSVVFISSPCSLLYETTNFSILQNYHIARIVAVVALIGGVAYKVSRWVHCSSTHRTLSLFLVFTGYCGITSLITICCVVPFANLVDYAMINHTWLVYSMTVFAAVSSVGPTKSVGHVLDTLTLIIVWSQTLPFLIFASQILVSFANWSTSQAYEHPTCAIFVVHIVAVVFNMSVLASRLVFGGSYAPSFYLIAMIFGYLRLKIHILSWLVPLVFHGSPWRILEMVIILILILKTISSAGCMLFVSNKSQDMNGFSQFHYNSCPTSDLVDEYWNTFPNQLKLDAWQMIEDPNSGTKKAFERFV